MVYPNFIDTRKEQASMKMVNMVLFAKYGLQIKLIMKERIGKARIKENGCDLRYF